MIRAVLARYQYAQRCELRLCAEVAAGWDRGGVPERGGAAGDCGSESGAAGGAGSGEGGAGEYCGVEGGEAGDGVDYAARDQLDDRGVRDAGVGEAGVSG